MCFTLHQKELTMKYSLLYSSMKAQEFFGTHALLMYNKGEMILRAEDPPHGVYYIERGVVRQYTINSVGETLMLQLYCPGAFFPMTWVMNNSPNHYFFEAVTPVFIRRAPREDMRRFLDAHPEILKDFVERLLTGIIGLWSHVEHLVLELAYTKTIFLILYFANKFGKQDGGG